MPAVYVYEVTQERKVKVRAESPTDAVVKATEIFKNVEGKHTHAIEETDVRAWRT